MQKRPHSSNDHRLLFTVAFCAVLGAILNSSTAWAESTNCLQSENPSVQCLSKPPTVSAIEGGMMGLMAGAGAALGAVCKRFL